MAGEVLKFPRPEKDNSGQKERELTSGVREPKVLEKFDLGRSQDLLVVVQRITSGCQALLEFIHANRDLSRKAGIETIAIELAASLEGEPFERIMDALEEAAGSGEELHLTTEGLARLRRMETLLAEASNNINRFTYGGQRLAEVARARADREVGRAKLGLKVAEKRLEALREKYKIRDYAAEKEIALMAGSPEWMTVQAKERVRLEGEQRKVEIEIAEKKLAALRDEAEVQGYAAHREADILAGIDELNDVELAEAAPIDRQAAPGMNSNALLWGSVIAFGAVAVTLVIIAATTAASREKAAPHERP